MYESDLDILRSPHAWLNDHCILFWQQYLSHIEYKQYIDRITFLQPAAAFSLQFLDLEDLLEGSEDNIFLSLSSKEVVLTPIVSDADAELGGGSHWALLMSIRESQGHSFYLLDSSGDSSGVSRSSIIVTQKKV